MVTPPVLRCIAPAPAAHGTAAEMAAADIPGDCQSPMARWFDFPTNSTTTSAVALQSGPPINSCDYSQAPNAQPAAFYFMVPMPMPSLVAAPSQEMRTTAATPPLPEEVLSERTSRYGDSGYSTEVGADSEDCADGVVTGTAPRLSSSASRRRRRQKAAAYAKLALGGTAEAAPDQHADTKAIPPTERSDRSTAAKPRGGIQDRMASLTTRLQQGPASVREANAELRGQVRRLSLHSDGCRAVQLALEVAEAHDAAELVSELHGSVRRAIASPHGNYVIQKIIQVMPVEISNFVIEELKGDAAEVSRHRYGCRIVCRLLEHTATHPMTIALVDEVLQASGELSRHSYGHHVLESILEYGSARQKHRIVVVLLAEIALNLRSGHATFVLDMALKHCSAADKHALACALLKEQVGEGQGIQRARTQLMQARKFAEKQAPGVDALALRSHPSAKITKQRQRS